MITAIQVIGGLGLFLYGMNIMGAGLQKTAGSRLKRLIEVLTSNIFMGVIMGAVVTFFIQSSSATTVMVIGFVNAGLMTLNQACGVIMGANIGTTVTSQLIALNITEYTPILIGIGMAIFILTNKEKMRDVAEVLIGIGILFVGMSTMKAGLSPLAGSETFREIMLSLNNPILGLIVGVLLTTIVQSSSASIGLLQALASQGLLSMNLAFPILFGDNIGTTTTAMLSSVGANKTAKRAAIIHFLFNFIGTVIFMLLLRKPVQMAVQYLTPDDIPRQIANAHTLFNFVNVIIQLPFYRFLVKAAEKIAPGDIEEDSKTSKFLDRRLLDTPFVALEQVRKEIIRMGALTAENILNCHKVLIEGNTEVLNAGYQNEKVINQLQREITQYLVDLSHGSVTEEEHRRINQYLNTISDIERIGDHCENILELGEGKKRDDVEFTAIGIEELNHIFRKCMTAFDKTMIAFENNSEEEARATLAIEDEVDTLEATYRDNHIQRLNTGVCATLPGIIFLDVISNLERVSDHCSNISLFVLDNFKDKEGKSKN